MYKKIKRITTGIKGLDKLIEGGLPEKSMTLVTGSCGTGKSNFGMQFLVDGASHDEPGLFISLEEYSGFSKLVCGGYEQDQVRVFRPLLSAQRAASPQPAHGAAARAQRVALSLLAALHTVGELGHEDAAGQGCLRRCRHPSGTLHARLRAPDLRPVVCPAGSFCPRGRR